MPDKKVRDISLGVVDNGFKLRWCEFTPKQIKNSSVKISTEGDYTYPEEVYEFENGQKAIERMMELAGRTKKEAEQMEEEVEG